MQDLWGGGITTELVVSLKCYLKDLGWTNLADGRAFSVQRHQF